MFATGNYRRHAGIHYTATTGIHYTATAGTITPLSSDTAESTAIIYSFMGCCKASSVDFRSWMIYFLEHVHDYDTDYTIDVAELLPDKLRSAGIL